MKNLQNYGINIELMLLVTIAKKIALITIGHRNSENTNQINTEPGRDISFLIISEQKLKREI